jgi:hypothetical protein
LLQYITRIDVQAPAMELDTNRSMYIMEFVRILNSFSLILFSFAQWFIAIAKQKKKITESSPAI